MTDVKERDARREASDAHSDLSGLTELHAQLDDLWERYLNFLDQYQVAQKELQKQSSSGFFSLAQANFKSLDRKRYGHDFYDERMKATRRCQLMSDDEHERVRLCIKLEPGEEPVEPVPASEDAQGGEVMPQQQPSPPATPGLDEHQAQEVSEKLSAAQKPGEQADAAAPAKSASSDPIRWFGVLVPPQLRTAQAAFISAVAAEGPVLKALNAEKMMREVEVEIGRVRKRVKKTEKSNGLA